MTNLPTALNNWQPVTATLSNDSTDAPPMQRSLTEERGQRTGPRVIYDASQQRLTRGLTEGALPRSKSVTDVVVPPWQRTQHEQPPQLPKPPPLTPLLPITRQLYGMHHEDGQIETAAPGVEQTKLSRPPSFERTPPASTTASTAASSSSVSTLSKTLPTLPPVQSSSNSTTLGNHQQYTVETNISSTQLSNHEYSNRPLPATLPQQTAPDNTRFVAESPIARHLNGATFDCPMCNQRLPTLELLNVHLDEQHMGSPPPSSTRSPPQTFTAEPEEMNLVCPICQRSAPTLRDLNIHLDTAHGNPSSPPSGLRHQRQTSALYERPSTVQHRRNLSGNTLPTRFNSVPVERQHPFDDQYADDSDDDDFDPAQAVMDWFRQAQRKLAPAKNKLTQLAVRAINSAEGGNTAGTSGDTPQLAMVDANVSDEDDDIRRDHWQPFIEGTVCSALGCAERRGPLTLRTGKAHCRRCGRLFCSQHCACAMRLDRNARHDPKNGRWYRVCDDCFQAREGYGEHEGLIRVRTELFKKSRQQAVERSNLEANRLKKRLEKLARAYMDPSSVVGSTLMRIKQLPQVQKQIEQTVVAWDADNTTESCPLCGDGFTKLTKRKHHCRLCGHIICGQIQCSQIYSVTSAGDFEYPDEQQTAPIVGQMRVCSVCYGIVTRRHIKQRGVVKQTPLLELYELLQTQQSKIGKLLPKFHTLAQTLMSYNEANQDIANHPNRQMASNIRKELTDTFAEYDTISKKIMRLPANNETEKRLQREIYNGCNLFLQKYKLTLSLLPKVSRSSSIQSTTVSVKSPNPEQTDTAMDKANSLPPIESPKQDVASPSTDEIDAQGLRETLAVLRDQKDRVEAYMREAIERRKFEDVQSLKLSLDDLETEINNIRNQLRDG